MKNLIYKKITNSKPSVFKLIKYTTKTNESGEQFTCSFAKLLHYNLVV